MTLDDEKFIAGRRRTPSLGLDSQRFISIIDELREENMFYFSALKQIAQGEKDEHGTHIAIETLEGKI